MIQNRSIKQNKEKAWSYLNWVQPAPREGRQNAVLTNSLEPDGCTDCSSSGWDPFLSTMTIYASYCQCDEQTEKKKKKNTEKWRKQYQ